MSYRKIRDIWAGLLKLSTLPTENPGTGAIWDKTGYVVTGTPSGGGSFFTAYQDMTGTATLTWDGSDQFTAYPKWTGTNFKVGTAITLTSSTPETVNISAPGSYLIAWVPTMVLLNPTTFKLRSSTAWHATVTGSWSIKSVTGGNLLNSVFSTSATHNPVLSLPFHALCYVAATGAGKISLVFYLEAWSPTAFKPEVQHVGASLAIASL